MEDKKIKKVVAITACTYGLAHTYMAEQELIKYAKKNNIEIKVETRGAQGDLNVITEDDLKDADGVIIASDRKIDIKWKTKFTKIIKTTTQKVIKNPQEVFYQLEHFDEQNFIKKIITSTATSFYPNINFAESKTFGYIDIALLALGFLVYFQTNQFGDQNIVKKLLTIFQYGAIIAPCLFASYLGFSVAKKNTSIFFLIAFFSIGFQIYDKITQNSQFSFIFLSIIAVVLALLFNIFKKIDNITFINEHKLVRSSWHFILRCLLLLIIIVIFWFLNNYLLDASDFLYKGLHWLNTQPFYYTSILCAIFMFLIMYDCGGPVNKWALNIAGIIVLDTFAKNYEETLITPLTAVYLGISVPGIAIYFRAKLFKGIISTNEYNDSIYAGKQAMKGIGEDTLKVTDHYKIQYQIANLFIAIFTGAVIGYFNIKFWGGVGNIYGALIGFSTWTWDSSSLSNLAQKINWHYLKEVPNLGWLILCISTYAVGTLCYSACLIKRKA